MRRSCQRVRSNGCGKKRHGNEEVLAPQGREGMLCPHASLCFHSGPCKTRGQWPTKLRNRVEQNMGVRQEHRGEDDGEKAGAEGRRRWRDRRRDAA